MPGDSFNPCMFAHQNSSSWAWLVVSAMRCQRMLRCWTAIDSASRLEVAKPATL